MMTVIMGGSGSGKSAYAEALACAETAVEKRYYVATMQVYDAEGAARVEKHRDMRAGKGFLTIEQPYDIGDICSKIEPKESLVLLECMSNLVANEMFRGKKPKAGAEVVSDILAQLTMLCGCVSHLIIVTNNVFEDGTLYDSETMNYIEALGRMNEKLAELADEVIEVVYTIPLTLQRREPCR